MIDKSFEVKSNLEQIKIEDTQYNEICNFLVSHHQPTEHMPIDFLQKNNYSCCATCLFCDMEFWSTVIYEYDKCRCEPVEDIVYADNICDGYINHVLIPIQDI